MRQTVSERGDNYCSGQLSGSVLTWGGSARQGEPSPVAEIGHYRGRREGEQPQTHTQTCISSVISALKEKAQCGRLTRRDPLTRSATSCFQASAGSRNQNLFFLRESQQ